jgi:YHS domain-containing protein
MLRLILYAVIIYLVYRVAKGFLGTGKKIDRSPPAGEIDELVQDPMCEKYIPRMEAVRKVVRGKEHFFCSTECAERYASKDVTEE